MLLQNRSRHLRDYAAFDAVFHRLCLPLIRNRADNCAGFYDLLDRHRYGLLRDILKRRKPSFAKLLSAAGVVEIDDDVRLVGLKIGRRIVESEMPVFADANKRDLD